MRTATKQEAINGNSNDTVITPLRLKQVLDTVDINPGEGGGSSDTPVYTAGDGISITNNVITNTITKTSQLTNDSNFITADDIPEASKKEEVALQYSKPTNGEDLWIQRSDNLFIPNVTKKGYRIKSDGSLEYKADTRYWINDYQEIEPNTVYTFGHKVYASTSYHAWYDANKNFISAFQQINNEETTKTSPSNAKYIRFSLFSGNENYGDDLKTFQFVKGRTIPNYYAPYMKGTKLYTKTSSDYEKILDTEEKFTLPIASADTLGGVKIGNNLTIDDNGVLSATGGGTTGETDPTVPEHVKAITQADIAKWNTGTGGGNIDIESIVDFPKNAITLKLDADVTCVAGDYMHLPLSKYTSEGESLTCEDGYVKIGKGIDKVLVSASAKFKTKSTGSKHIHVDKNKKVDGEVVYQSTIAWVLENSPTASNGVVPNVTPILVEVAEGDLIDVKYYAKDGDVVGGHNVCYTYLTVQAVEDGKNITINNYTNDNPESGGGITEETDPVFTESPAYNITEEDINNWNNYTNLGITTEDIDNWNNKQEQLVSGVNIKTIDGQSVLGSGNISTEYTAGEGINIEGRVISNAITSYNDLKDLPFIPTKITDLIGGEDFPTDPENPDDNGPWARVDRNNYFRTDQTVIGDVNADKVKASTQLSISALGFYKESDGSYTLGKVAE